ncbi:helix-turn-helix transcriptional regulator [Martelella endophytica]|uniref:Transcriptional regulator n=1 Tax=Martelella endophytica TaxID=1486262 RepID=A0A0D5LQ85_MAREN|nr:metalloregulator ArsR/SmtB family transcription factor [Martelella endophytica]AJY45917.1 transcriptional regulator [Martelella endophytica]
METADITPWTPRSAAERILMQLKMRGPLTSAEFGKLLGTTGEAARQQLMRLGEDGLVTATSKAGGVGRPRQEWALTAAGQARFPDTHAQLTLELLDSIRSELGEEALDTLIAARESKTKRTYAEVLAGKTGLKQRVATLSALRSAEGYMAEWREADDGALLLIENHCPICAAATACQGFCRAEMDVFRSQLGPDVDIRRAEHIVSGGRRCTYVIRERA